MPGEDHDTSSAVSPAGDGSIVTVTITSDGSPIPDVVDVQSITTTVALNEISRAQLVLYDGDAASAEFPISDSKTFAPGAAIEISAGYDTKNAPIFSGVVIRQAVEVDPSLRSRLTVEVAGHALALTLARKNAVFAHQTDSDIIATLIANAGLRAQVASTRVEHEHVVQHDASDWDMLMMRAQVNGLVVLAEGDRLRVEPPDTSARPELRVTYGEDLLSANVELDAPSQVARSAVASTAWDPTTQQVVKESARAVRDTGPGTLSSEVLAKVFGVPSLVSQTGAPVERGVLAEWATARLQQTRLARIQGSVEFQGSSRAKAGGTIEVAGLGTRFNGQAYISGVRHQFSEGRWTTICRVGMSPDWFAAKPAVAAPAASCLLPPVQGLQTGVVRAVANDPDGEFRVQVELPLLQAEGGAMWVRLASFYASNAVGAVFYPEVDDEVIVGFMNDDPSSGVILGSVYSTTRPPPYPPDVTNKKKAIVTRSNLELTFDDEDKIIEITTPAGQRVTLDDTNGVVVVEDRNSNTVTMSSSGIVLDSQSDIALRAHQDISIEANSITLKAEGSLSAEGAQVTHEASGTFSATGGSAAELVASGTCTVRGSIVKIN